MPITLRHLKKAPLTIEELDGNFEDLDNRIRHFEKHSEALESIGEITSKEGKLVIMSNKGSLLGEITLPSPKLHFKGKWQASKTYFTNDLVTYESKLLICVNPHCREAYSFEDWEIAFEIPASVAPSLNLPIYEKNQLPSPKLGQMAILIDKIPIFIVGNGQTWQEIPLKNLA